MIEVRCSNGDSAEAETPEAALVAARALAADDHDALPIIGRKVTFSFYVDGKLSRCDVPESEIR